MSNLSNLKRLFFGYNDRINELRMNPHDLNRRMEDEFVEHPLYIPILNAMVECSVAGIKPMDSITNPLTILPLSINAPVDPSPIDQFMFDALESQWTHKTELEVLHNSINDFCKSAIYNLEKTTAELLSSAPDEVQEHSSSFRLRPPLHEQMHPHPCYPSTPLPDSYHSSELVRQRSPSTGKRAPKSLPKEARAILKAWILGMKIFSTCNVLCNLIIFYLEHWEKPYPDERTKSMLIEQTGLTRSQVINWFINARRRLIKPLREELERQKKENGLDEVSDEEVHEPPKKRPCLDRPDYAGYHEPGDDEEDDIEIIESPKHDSSLRSYTSSTISQTPGVACYPPTVFE